MPELGQGEEDIHPGGLLCRGIWSTDKVRKASMLGGHGCRISEVEQGKEHMPWRGHPEQGWQSSDGLRRK